MKGCAGKAAGGSTGEVQGSQDGAGHQYGHQHRTGFSHAFSGMGPAASLCH